LAAQKNLGIYDALFVQLARELDLPLLTTDLRLSRAGEGSARIDDLYGVKKPHPA
jgi:predicted nucleic acid-binding protein